MEGFVRAVMVILSGLSVLTFASLIYIHLRRTKAAIVVAIIGAIIFIIGAIKLFYPSIF